MKVPTYIWVCHKCGKSNPPHTDKCASCDFSAISSEAEIHPETEEERKQKSERNANITSNIWFFFPEGFIAGLLALYSPYWAIDLIIKGHYLAAIALAAVVLICGYGFIWSMRHNFKFVAYLVIICFCLGAWGINGSLA